MKNSNVKLFTAFTYSILLVLILGSVVFLVVQRTKLARQTEIYTSQLIDRINSSYMRNKSFSSTDFTSDVKNAMLNFSDQIKLITILGPDGSMLNRFRVETEEPNRNPYWQSQVPYKYNSFLYEEQSYDLPNQNIQVQLLYQRLPVDLVKNVLQFDTIVILALLILSFLAFLIIPKRDLEDSAWALRSVAEENDDLYQEENVWEEEEWENKDLPEEWKSEDDEDQFEQLLAEDSSDPSWEEDDDLKDLLSGESSEEDLGDTADFFTDELAYDLNESQGDDLIDDLDEGLGDDGSKELDDDVFSKLLSMAEEDEEIAEPIEPPLLASEILGWLDNLMEGQSELALALVETEELEAVQSSIEQDLDSEAQIRPYGQGFAIFLPGKTVQSAVTRLQEAVGQLPATYLENLRVGITSVSSARNASAKTLLQEAEYALSQSDAQNSISIFDTNDQIFNQQ